MITADETLHKTWIYIFTPFHIKPLFFYNTYLENVNKRRTQGTYESGRCKAMGEMYWLER